MRVYYRQYYQYKWVILLNLVHTGYLQFYFFLYNLAGNEHGFLAKH